MNKIELAEKIFTIHKDGICYNWYITQNKCDLIGRMGNGSWMKHTHDIDETDGYVLVEKVMKLLYDGYSISVNKNRSGIGLNNHIIRKYIHIIKKYYGKYYTLDCALRVFLKFWSSYDAGFPSRLVSQMKHINKIIEGVKNKNKVA